MKVQHHQQNALTMIIRVATFRPTGYQCQHSLEEVKLESKTRESPRLLDNVTDIVGWLATHIRIHTY